LSWSRTRRICSTAVSCCFFVSLIADHLPRISYFEDRIPLLQVYRVEGVNAPQVDDVLEVPVHEHVNPSHRRNGSMEGIGPLFFPTAPSRMYSAASASASASSDNTSISDSGIRSKFEIAWLLGRDGGVPGSESGKAPILP
jgi:hypothetical protein